MSNRQKPDFIIVGAAKSGTTSLYHQLCAHPDIFMPDFKEPHYFVADQKLNFDIVKTQKQYNELFIGHKEKCIGEASTGYLYFSGTAAKIKKKLPNCKIIAIVRNPTSRAFSMWGHQIREGLEKMSFSEAIKEELEGKTRHVNGVEYGFNYCRLGFISNLLKEYQQEFGTDNVFIGDYNLLKNKPEQLMEKLYDFLQVPLIVTPQSSKRYNASGNPKFPWLHSFLNSDSHLRKNIIKPLKLIIGKKQRHELWQVIRNWNITSGNRHIMPDKEKTLLDKHFSNECKALKKMMF